MRDVVLPLAPAFALACVLTLALTPIARVLARSVGMIAGAKQDRWHRGSIPLLGGLAIWAAAILTFSLLGQTGFLALTVGFVGSLMFLIGLADDYFKLRPITKLTAQIAVACLVLYLDVTTPWTAVEPLNSLLTITWIVGITNAFNLLDNMDGLAAGIAAISATTLALTLQAGSPMAVPAAAIAGASAGFLVYNFKPASIFMGDSGSLFLGASLAVLSRAAEHPAGAPIVSTLLVPVLIMLIPIFDVTFVTLSRTLSKRAASRGGTDHTSHRLVAMGFPEREAVLLLYVLAALGGTAALLLNSAERGSAVILGVLLVGLLLLGVQLARVRVYDGQDFAVLRDTKLTPLIVEVTFRRRLFEIALDVGLISLAYYTAYVLRFDTAYEFGVYYPLFVQSLPVVIATQLLSLFIAGVYRGVWRYVSLSDTVVYLRGVALALMTSMAVIVYLYRFHMYSRGVFMIDGLLLLGLLLGTRFSFRGLAEVASRRRRSGRATLIYGAGEGGLLLIRELRGNPKYDFLPIGWIDDDPKMRGKRVYGLPVVGGLDQLPALIGNLRPEVLILSTREISPDRLDAVRKICFASGTELRELEFRLSLVDQSTTHPG